MFVKWTKETYEVEVDLEQPPIVFKSQLFALTSVPPERQKILVKGGVLKDDADWDSVGLRDGQKVMMMGTADPNAIIKPPEKSVQFVEDLPEEEQVDRELLLLY